MSPVLVVLTVATLLGSALMAGVFFAFSTLVMWGLARLPSEQGISAMQSINVAAYHPVFLGVLVGTALGCVALVGVGIFGLGDPGTALRLAGVASYLIGAMLLTVVYHVPRNDALAEVDPEALDADDRWRRYVGGWTAWNDVRAAAALVATALFALSLR
jgi:uncharacterized membrane protein